MQPYKGFFPQGSMPEKLCKLRLRTGFLRSLALRLENCWTLGFRVLELVQNACSINCQTSDRGQEQVRFKTFY